MTETTSYQPLLPGIGVAGFRSIPTWQEFNFPTKVTVLAGTNNSGKSNLLRFIQVALPALARTKGNRTGSPGSITLSDLDRPRGFAAVSKFEVGIPVRLGSLGEHYDPRVQSRVRPRDLAGYQEAVMTLLSNDDEWYWSRYVKDGDEYTVASERVEEAIACWPHWNNVFQHALTALGGGTVNAYDVMRRLIGSIGGFSRLPPVVTISSSRRVEGTEAAGTDWLSGRGIIHELGALQNPQHGEWEDARIRWTSINRFVQTVLGDPNASLNIPYDFSTIQVETPQRVLPLVSLGSGIEQVVILAAAATVTSDTLVCLEEPETNLHPLLQKKLVRYLTDETNNQYVIATHSSHLLDDDRATAYHIRLTQDGSVASLARRPHELVAICHDLGYRPSDLLQANCVIWVEGPSDRIYLRRWIELEASDLVEGIDYSIMFYGGKLLAHLTADEDALRQFINLRYLNRSSAILIDSDKTSAQARINATKKRIRTEFESNRPAPGFAWVTKCNTIENYLPVEVLEKAVEQAHPGRGLGRLDQWSNPLPSNHESGPYNKIAIAAAAADLLKSSHLGVLDLQTRIRDLCDFIRAANGQSIAPDPS